MISNQWSAADGRFHDLRPLFAAMPATLSPESSAVGPRPAAPVRTKEGSLKTWLPMAVFSVLWLDLCRLLSSQWETREQYAYGWFVPLFAAGLFWRRWSDRPLPAPEQREGGSPASGFRFQVSAFILLLALSLLPLRVIFEINRDWPLMGWLYAGIVVTATLYAFFLAGGRAWVKHFAFPVALILVGVVWPYRIERGLTQGLMRLDANLTVELLGWIDIPALQRGNLIELSTGTLGINEACSGIRSFQSSLMAALVMGELYRFRLRPRAALILCGIVLGFGFNVVRTLLLSWLANKNGISATGRWHDPAGMTITVACFFALWALAVLMRRWTRRPSAFSFHPSAFSPGPFPRRYLLALGCWALISIGATEAWYRCHANPNSGKFCWTVAMPVSSPGFQKIELPPRTLQLLSFDEGATGKWTENGMEWSAHFFRWKPRSIESVITSRIHRPERCLPAAGLSQVSESKLLWYDAGQFKLPFRKYVFEGEGRTLFVFFCQWEDGFKEQAGMQASNQADRLQSVLSGRRLVGQQTLELILGGYPSLDAAEQAVRDRLPALIRPDA